MATLALGATACIGPFSEDIESHYVDAAAARRAGAYERGWLPEFVPPSATDISELHNLDSNRTWACFSNPGSLELLRSLLEKQGATRMTGPISGGPPALVGTRSWWSAAMARPDVEAYRLDEGSRFILLVEVDPASGRACFQRRIHP